MNQGLFRLVFSKHLNMFVPASEATTRRAKQSSSQRIAGRVNSKHRALIAMAALGSLGQSAMAASLPPMLSTQIQNMLPAGIVPDAVHGMSGVHIDYNLSNHTLMTLVQEQNKAIANWSQFNLNHGETVNIKDQAGWSMLHRIYDLDPSFISGVINAKGHQYFYNANGIVFGDGAQINVGSLTATSLNITDELFKAGEYSLNYGLPSFVYEGLAGKGDIKVLPNAHITAATGGKVMLLGPNVENSGIIKTPQGQTILAAGNKVYLLDRTDPAGYLVEVSSGGTATNLGKIFSELGNVSMVGLAVNQQGVVNATTSVRAKGSIILKAQDIAEPDIDIDGTVNKSSASYTMNTTGNVVLGANSTTVVSNDLKDKEATLAAQTFKHSSIDITGNQIDIEGKVIAHGGDVNVKGITAKDADGKSTVAPRVYLGKAALIDVSGENVTVDMSQNQLSVQLFSDQLKDSPVLRNSGIRNATVYIDARKGTEITDVAALKAAQIKQTVGEKNVVGGNVNITVTSTNDTQTGEIITRTGSKIDVSGGSTHYNAGEVKESTLVYNGQMVAISNASKATPYTGTADQVSTSSTKWNTSKTWNMSSVPSQYNEAYTEGNSAGTVKMTGKSVVLDGDLSAATVVGDYQRNTDSKGNLSYPIGGRFELNTPDTLQKFGSYTTQLNSSVGFNSALSETQSKQVLIDTRFIKNGFNSFTLNGADDSAVTDQVNLKPNGSLKLGEGYTHINADIVAPGGTVTASNVTLAKGVDISVGGVWTNDKLGSNPDLTAPIAVNAGKISLGIVTMDGSNHLDASAGAWQQSNGALLKGSAGSIALSMAKIQATQSSPLMTAYGFGQGGTLTLTLVGNETSNNLVIGGAQPNNGSDSWLPTTFFEQGGFGAFKLRVTSAIDTVNPTVLIGDTAGQATVLHPKQENFIVSGNVSGMRSGTAMQAVFQHAQLAEVQRAPTSLDISVANVSGTAVQDKSGNNGSLTLLQNASIVMDAPFKTNAGANVALSSGGRMDIQGDISAPAGNITLSLTGDPGVDNKASMVIGERSTISAAGSYSQAPSNNGALNAKVYDAGSIKLEARGGAIVQKAGSVLDVSGAEGQVVLTKVGGGEQTLVHSNAGNISVQALDGVVLDGEMKASAGGTAKHGSFSLTMTGSPDQTNANFNDTGASIITLTNQKQVLAAGFQSGNRIDDSQTSGNINIVNKGQISADQLERAGFADVTLKTDRTRSDGQERVMIQSGVDLKVGNSLTIDTTVIQGQGSGNSTLAAPYIKLMNGNTRYIATTDSSSNLNLTNGDTALTFKGNWIDLSGKLSVDQVKNLNLSSQLDIRGSDVSGAEDGNVDVSGWLVSPSPIRLTARQVYPITGTSFLVESRQNGTAPSSVAILSSGEAPTAVLSAGGNLTIKADTIDQQGVIKAPLGKITLDAKNDLTLGKNSLTTVSAKGQLIPYGYTNLSGQDWYLDATGKRVSKITQPSAKSVEVKAKNINMMTGAIVDESAGGDIMAYEWMPGLGGSSDYLASPNVYAVIPGLKTGDYAPSDYLYAAGSTLKPGDSVYLSGGSGLAAGNYTLLPARYALLPGAYLVQVSSSTVAQGQTAQMSDGSSVVTGYWSTLGGSRNEQATSFIVTDASMFRTTTQKYSEAPAEYKLTYGNQYFTNLATSNGTTTPQLPMDAGQFVINASKTLTLNGTLLTNAGKGRGAQVDIVSDDITVVDEKDSNVTNTLQITATDLNNLHAGSILLGGTRTTTSQGETITTSSSKVSIENDSSHALAVNEVILTAKDKVTLAADASVNTTKTNKVLDKTITVNGDGALFAASSNRLDVVRTNVSSTATTGTLEVAARATVESQKSLILDATLSSTLEGTLTVAKGGQVAIAAPRILLGDANNQQGFLIDNAQLAKFGDLNALKLTSYSNIDLFGNVDFGNKAIDITLNTGALGGNLAKDQTARISANTLTISNDGGYIGTTRNAGENTTLTIDANNVKFAGVSDATAASNGAAGKVHISGFEAIHVNAEKSVEFSGNGATIVHAGNNPTTFNITSAYITATSGANYNLAKAVKGDSGSEYMLTKGDQVLDSKGASYRLTSDGHIVGITDGTVVGSSGALYDIQDGTVVSQTVNGKTTYFTVDADGKIINSAGKTVDTRSTISSNGNTFDGSIVKYSAIGSSTQVIKVGSSYYYANTSKTSGAFRVFDASGTQVATITSSGSSLPTNGTLTASGALSGQSFSKVTSGAFAIKNNSTGAVAGISVNNNLLNSIGVTQDTLVGTITNSSSNISGTTKASYAVVDGKTVKDNGNVTAFLVNNAIVDANGVNIDQAFTDSLSANAATVSFATTGNGGVLPSAGSSSAATLSVIGDAVKLGGNVSLKSGTLNAIAKSGNLEVDQANLTVASGNATFVKTSKDIAAGNLNLIADKGNVLVSSSSTLNVSGTNTANAGTLNLSALEGKVTLNGTAKGDAGSHQTSGKAVVVSNDLTNLSALNQVLNAGGFHESREYTASAGNVSMQSTDTVKANHITLNANAGAVEVAGKLDASSDNQGSITVSARDDVTLHAGAELLAKSTDANANGGKVSLNTKSGSLNLDGGVIDVSGGAKAKGGVITLQAPRTADNTDIQVSNLTTTMTGARKITLEGTKTYQVENTTIGNSDSTDQTTSGNLFNDAQSFLVSVITDAAKGLARLGKQNDDVFQVTPGIEVDSNSNMSVNQKWDLSTWRFDPQTGLAVTDTALLASGKNENNVNLIAGGLSLKAAGDLNINASLTDAFVNDTTLQDGHSWAYTLVSGANLNDASPTSTASGSGNFALSSNQLIRTGDAGIAIAAGRNITLKNDSSVIYTVGNLAADVDGFVAPSFNNPKAVYMDTGGDISITAGGNITGALPKTTSGTISQQQIVNNWLYRSGDNQTSVSWWARPDLFKQGVATLGGGNVNITAGDTITNVSASAATNGRVVNGVATITGGGDVNVTAAGDILSGVYYAGKGHVNLDAGGQIAASSGNIGTIVALQDADLNMRAAKSILLETVFNPTLFAQAAANKASTQNNTVTGYSYFNTYSDRTAVNVESANGDVFIGGDSSTAIDASFVAKFTSNSNNLLPEATNTRAALTFMPAQLTVLAMNGDIQTQGLKTVSSPTGNVVLLAGGSISNVNGSLLSENGLSIAGAAKDALPTISAPTYQLGAIASNYANYMKLKDASLHVGDVTPVQLESREGDIQFGIDSPKAVVVKAGRDAVINLVSNHKNDSDLTVVSAGRDVLMKTGTQLSNTGSGVLLITAGRNIDLADSIGINTVHSDIVLLAGLGQQGTSVKSYVDQYINPEGAGPVSLHNDADKLKEYHASTNQALIAFMKQQTGKSMTVTEAYKGFSELDQDSQAVFAYYHFSSELQKTADTFVNTKSYERGYGAIASLFGSIGKGNISLVQSYITTTDGGSVYVLAPSGGVDVGVATASTGDLGIITQHGGSIRGYADTEFQVNESKVTTLFGTPITVWVNNGDIDAGRGSKTALTVPIGFISTDADGKTTIHFVGVAEGSGIRAQTYDPDGPGPLIAPPKGKVTLVAPRGVLNLGEAGIEGGDIVIVSPNPVVGVGGISSTGSVSGASTTTSGAVGAPTGNPVSDATKSVTDTLTSQLSQSLNDQSNSKNKTAMPSILTFKLLGLGDFDL